MISEDRARHTSITKEMGFTHDDFYAKIPELLEGTPFRQGKDHISFDLDDGRVEIHLGTEQTRPLGPSIQMPYTIVRLDFFDCFETRIDKFLHHFKLTFMRGGG